MEIQQTNDDINEKTKQKFRGKVIKVIIDRYGKYCGFIERSPNNIFFHSNQNRDVIFTNLEGKSVYYEVSINPRNNMPIAVSVKVAEC